MKTVARKLVAVGDLHGDFYRLTRILADQELLDSNQLQWTPEASQSDVILLGDYVDWRGERLEGPATEWPAGARRVVELLFALSGQTQQLRKTGFRGCFYPLLGNHDQMMLDGYKVAKKISGLDPKSFAQYREAEDFLNGCSRRSLPAEIDDDLLGFLNWYSQGGENTIRSFGGFLEWISAMEGELGNYLRALPVSVVVNRKLFSHSIPDSKEYWVPLKPENQLPEKEYAKVREQYLWGRKIWGYDVFEGAPTNPFTEEEIDELLRRFGVDAVVVGHTALSQDGRPYLHFGGKVINLDSHGIPGSSGFVEEYVLSEPRRKPGRGKVKKSVQARRRLGRG